jgi:hypothetical protein
VNTHLPEKNNFGVTRASITTGKANNRTIMLGNDTGVSEVAGEEHIAAPSSAVAGRSRIPWSGISSLINRRRSFEFDNANRAIVAMGGLRLPTKIMAIG